MGSLHNDTLPDDVGFVDEMSELVPELEPTAMDITESSTCAWSPDGSLFAWSYGNKSVKIIPWTKIQAKEPVFDAEDFIPRKRSGSLTTQYIELSKKDDQRRNSAGAPLTQYVTINCGHTVHSVAFGSGGAKTVPGSIRIKPLRLVDGMILATGLSNGRLRIWDVFTGGLLWELMDHRDLIGQLKFSPTGRLELASACRDGTVKLWDMKDDGNMYKTLRACQLAQHWAFACAWSPDGKYLATVGSHKTAVIWDVSTLRIYRKLEGHHHDVLDCDFSPDGALLVTCSFDTRVIIWDSHTGDQVRIYCHLFPTPHPVLAGGYNGAYVRSVSFSHDGMHITSACDDGLLRFWDLEKEDLPVKLAAIEGLSCVYRPIGDVVAVCLKRRVVNFYKIPLKVNALRNLCRMSIRSNVPYHKIDTLSVPIRHKEFLKYHGDL